MMEDEDEDGERLEDIEMRNGKVLSHEDMHAFPISPATIYFQGLLTLAAIYYATLLTNWGNPTVFDNSTDFYASNATSFWIKLVCQWITILIYILSLILPIIFPNREF